MQKFDHLSGIAAPLHVDNVDTDKIIPAQYLKTIKRTGLGRALFAELRYNDDGSDNADFVLNRPAYRGASILIAGDNFGCGSSREHAPWALLDFGIRCVISTSFADIFYNNCFKNGILPIVVTPEQLGLLFDDAERGANARISVDLARAGDPRPRRRRDPLRHRPVPEALPARGPRRRRPHHGQDERDRAVRNRDRRHASLGLIGFDAPAPRFSPRIRAARDEPRRRACVGPRLHH